MPITRFRPSRHFLDLGDRNAEVSEAMMQSLRTAASISEDLDLDVDFSETFSTTSPAPATQSASVSATVTLHAAVRPPRLPHHARIETALALSR